jgi:DNA-directed RNA polymerase specialized sigma24 family protein
MNLRTLRDRHSRIDSLKERIERLRSAMEIGSRQLKFAPAKTSLRNRLEEDMAKLDELERQLIGEIAALEQDAQNVERLLDELPMQQQRIMRLRYIDGLSWPKVSRKAHYSRRHCLRIHAVAVKKMSQNVTL